MQGKNKSFTKRLGYGKELGGYKVKSVNGLIYIFTITNTRLTF